MRGEEKRKKRKEERREGEREGGEGGKSSRLTGCEHTELFYQMHTVSLCVLPPWEGGP